MSTETYVGIKKKNVVDNPDQVGENAELGEVDKNGGEHEQDEVVRE